MEKNVKRPKVVPITPPRPSIRPDKEKIDVNPKIEKPLPATPKKK